MKRNRAVTASLALVAGLAGLAFLSPVAPGYATAVVSVIAGPGASSDPDLALDEPTGGGLSQGSMDIYTLGAGGSLTVQMIPPVVDGGGADLMVCENPFFVTGTLKSFSEAAFVEVSSDGVHFARLPNNYSGPDQPVPPFTGVKPAFYRGFAGIMPVVANPPLVDPMNVTAAGGDLFDLHELIGHPLVLADQLDLWNVRFVRLVDIPAGTAVDTAGHIIWDAGGSNPDSADIDAVVGLNTTTNQLIGRPHAEADQVNGFLVFVFEDPNGIADIKAGISFSVNGYPVPFGSLLPYFHFTFLSQTRVELTSLGPIPPGLFPAVIRFGLRDGAGMFSGDGVTIQ